MFPGSALKHQPHFSNLDTGAAQTLPHEQYYELFPAPGVLHMAYIANIINEHTYV